MPELPEVETTCQAIKSVITGQVIHKIILREPRLRWPVPLSLTKLKSATIISVTRRAKYLLLTTHLGTLIIHLGMSGRLNIATLKQPHQKHDHADIVLTNGHILRYTDPRRFGAILWTTTDPLQHPLLKHLGPEPFSNEFKANYLFSRSQKMKTCIKQLIMNAKIVVGVGNIYANEALFTACISPLRKSHSLTMIECQALVKAIRKVLRKAIAAGGTTLKDFLDPTGNPGYFSQELKVYGREHQNCLTCKIQLSSIKIAGRATVYCHSCQL